MRTMKTRILVSGVMVLLIWLAAAGSARAEGQCAALMNSVCLGCHDRDKFCDRLGPTEKQWQSLMKWMIANGAELEEDEVKLLVGCLSEPSEEAKKACGK